MLGLPEVPVILRQADDRAVLELALIENLQRENLNPIEEAQGYAQLIEQFQLKQDEVATKVGKSRTVVTNALRLLKLGPAGNAQLDGETRGRGQREIPQDFSPEAIERAIDAALKRLKTDRIDLLQLHNIRMEQVYDDAVWKTLEKLKAALKRSAEIH